MKHLPPMLAALLLALPLAAQEDTGTPLKGTTPAQWRLVWTEAPQTRALLAWTTAEAGDDHRVHLDTVSRGGDLSAYRSRVACQRNGQYSMARPELYYHHATLEGLEPATTYYVVMASDGALSREFHFRTAPADDRPLTILQGGDSRSDPVVRRRLNRRIASLAAERDALAFAHGGDYVFFGLSLRQWSSWLSDHELTVTAAGRLLPIIPTRGNHEAMGRLYDEVFGWPGGGLGKNYFATALSTAVVLVTLNTEIAAGGDQRAFLEATLQQNAARRWKVVQYHQALLPAVKRPARARPHWQPLFERHGVALACEGDGHTLKRTPPIRGDEVDEDGVVYVGEGGLGVPQRTPRTDRWYLQPPGTATSAHHVWELRFTDKALQVRAVGVAGAVLDETLLRPRAAAGAK